MPDILLVNLALYVTNVLCIAGSVGRYSKKIQAPSASPSNDDEDLLSVAQPTEQRRCNWIVLEASQTGPET